MSAKSKKIILLNPPASKGKIIIRDYYCSFSSKANYYWPPQDLVVLSGILSENYEIKVIDAIGQGINSRDCYNQILTKEFDVVIFSTGTATLVNDISFIESLKKKRDFKAVASSAIFEFVGREILSKFQALDAVLIDFFSPGIISYLEGDFTNVRGIVYRQQQELIKTESDMKNNFKFPVPHHEFFVYHRYMFPLCQKPASVVIASVGCPFKCKFCIASNINFRTRDLTNLLEEVRHIKSLGINDIFFADPTFTVNKNYVSQLCNEIKDLKIRWACNSHPSHLLDNDFVVILKKAGCHTIMVGVESGNEEILKLYSKGVTLKEIKKAFEICRKNGLHTLAYFILGFPGENITSILKTINFSKELDCDFISFDFATPDFGTELRKELIERNIISSDLLYGWDPSGEPLYSIDGLSKKDLMKLRNKAYRKFYLRPSYIKNKLLSINSPTRLKGLIQGGLSLFLKK
jgi:anaerobic magnesium-protoporphyrin IX monomethyl ester cyclase